MEVRAHRSEPNCVEDWSTKACLFHWNISRYKSRATPIPRNAGTTLYNGLTLHLVCHRPAKGEHLLLITNRTDLKQVLALYGKRWAIETTFGFLKSKGFNLQDTHLTHPPRLHLLIGLLAWTLLWAIKTTQ